MKKITLKNIQDYSSYAACSFARMFTVYVREELKKSEYKGKDCKGSTRKKLKRFFENVRVGAIAVAVRSFSCPYFEKFYFENFKHLDFILKNAENRMGFRLKNWTKSPDYAFIIWLAFVEFCNDIEYNIFDQE